MRLRLLGGAVRQFRDAMRVPAAALERRFEEDVHDTLDLLPARESLGDGEHVGVIVTPREFARELIEDCGARDATVALADEHLDLALAALDRVSLVPGPRSDLVAIARFVTERDR